MKDKTIFFTQFGSTVEVPHRTWTNNKEDIPPKDKWDEVLWIERGEDWYALMFYARQGKTVLVVEREDFLKALNKERREHENILTDFYERR